MIAVGLQNDMYVIIINGQIEVLNELGWTKVIDAMIALLEAEVHEIPPPPVDAIH